MFEEIIACHLHGKFKNFDEQRIYDQIQFYEEEKYSLLSPIYAAGVLFKRNNLEVKILTETWWTTVLSYTCRDQLSLSYALWKLEVIPYVFSINILDENPYFKRFPHSTSLLYYLKKTFKYILKSLKLK